jgi:predicted DCC family thiol-disulfide oxidoreductase YuxK
MKIILFDGECNLCDQTVQRIIRHDKAEVFHFASLQSRAGQKLCLEFGVSVNSVVLIDQGKVYTKSSAVLGICRYIPAYRWLLASYIVPKPVRDKLYNYIATHRYRWFGKRTECMIPTPSLERRFLK